MIKHNILVIAAHPDDEILGCCGTLLKYLANGSSVKIIYLSDGESSRDNINCQNINERKQQCLSALSVMGIEDFTFYDFPDNIFDSIPLLNIVKVLEDEIKNFMPTKIYTHHPHDLNIDHMLTSKALITAARPLPNSTISEINFFEIPSASNWNFSEKYFSPNKFVDITEYWDKKIECLKQYSNELREFPHPRSLQSLTSLAIYRGSLIGCEKAESFFIHRQFN